MTRSNHSRREWIQWGFAGAFAGAFALPLITDLTAAEVWESKPPAEWSDKDIEKLLSKSPWARKVEVDMGRGPVAVAPGGPMSSEGGGGGRGGGKGGGPAGDPGAGGSGGGGFATPEALIRWESAPPVLAALKRALPAETQGQYVISAAGFPVSMGGIGGPPPGAGQTKGPGGFNPEAMRAAQQAMFEKAKETTRLERKGRDPIHPSAFTLNGRTLYILFPREPQPISLDDKEVTLVLQIGLPLLKTKFTLKSMVFDGKLEL